MDRRDLLEKTLYYLYETSTAEERNIWIWDNASSDDTPDFLGTMLRWPGVRVFRSKSDLGIAGPRQRMLPHVGTPYILTLDDDIWMINRGWASAVVRVMEADPTIHQLAVGPTNGHPTNDYGVVHTMLNRPFFSVPPFVARPGKAIEMWDDFHWRWPDAKLDEVGGETVIVPIAGTQLPFSVSGNASVWRTHDVLTLQAHVVRHPIVDLREAWGFPLQEGGGTREATIMGYEMWHPSPGPLWHLGRGEVYWEERCRFAPAIYGRTGEVQRGWLEAARKASGWGQPLEDPSVLPEI